MSGFGPTKNGILELLDSKATLATPDFQRSFAWERAHVDEFWTDLLRALDAQRGPADYFVGLVVLDDSQQIQDGQQRLATTLLLASEVYEAIERAKATGPYEDRLARDTLAQVSSVLRESPNAPLSVSRQDQDVLLNRAGIRSEAPESAKRLDAARKRLREHVEKDLAPRTTPDSKLARLQQWGIFLRSRAYVVTLRVSPKDAHNIFETLNTRGVRLSNGNLVKSHLIARASSTSSAVEKWNAITSALTDARAKFEDDLESFLLHYYGSQYSKTTKRDFFADYRKRVDREDALVSLHKLLESARLYRALADPAASVEFWASIGSGTQQAIELLNGLGLKQLRYMLLAVIRDFASSKGASTRRRAMRDAVLKIASWSVRGLVHGQTGGAAAEGTYIAAAAKIRSGQIERARDLRQLFVDRDMLIVEDAYFKRAFKEFPFDRRISHTRARAILYALEYHKISNKSGLSPRGTLTVEHVLPQSPSDDQWTQFTADERRVLTYNLGNLLLVDGPSRANDDLANREWGEKRRIIRGWGTQTPLTHDALRRRQWTASTIEKRNDELAKLAVEAWSV